MEQHFELIVVVKSQQLQMHQNVQWIRVKACLLKLFASTSAALVPQLWAFLVGVVAALNGGGIKVSKWCMHPYH